MDPTGEAARGATIGGIVGAGLGGVAGGFLGGLGGTAVAPGVGTIGLGVAGAGQGAADGGLLGAALGSAIEDYCNEDKFEWVREQINENVSELEFRYNDLLRDRYGLFGQGKTPNVSWSGHIQKYLQIQNESRINFRWLKVCIVAALLKRIDG